jgi:peptide/nickel transport system substrate-binding protein
MDYFTKPKMPKRFISFWHFFLLLFLTLNAYASTLNLSISSNPSRLNPIIGTDSASRAISAHLFSGLFKYDKDGKIIVDIAESYKFISPTHLKIKLKKNVRWHDGVQFTSKDILFTYNTIKSPKIFTPYSGPFKKIKELKVINEYEIDIIYFDPYFKAVQMWMMGILPHHLLKDEKDLMTSSFNKNPIGTGPYTLKTLKTATDVILTVNKNYYDKISKISKIKYSFVPDTNTAFTLLNQQKLDLGSLTPLQLNRQLKESFKKDFAIYESVSFGYTYMGFNLNNKKFKDIRVRQAIDLALNKKEILDILYFSHAKVATGPFLEGSFAYNENVQHTIQNTIKAKRLLTQAGYTKENPLSFTVITNANNDIRVNTAQIIQYQLQKVGIDIKIRILEWQAFLNTVVMPKKFEAVILGWGLALMPDARTIWHSKSNKKGGFNFVSYNNKLVDKKIEKAEKTVDPIKLSKLYKEMYQEIVNDVPYVFLYVPNSITAISKKIQNVSPALTGITHNQEDWVKP